MTRRKDTKGRVLTDGETQGKDGRYRYQYTNALGERKAVYSWKLLPADRLPNGKRKDLSLREKEKQIKEDLNCGIVPCGNRMTVIELVEKYISQKTGVKHSTQTNYIFIMNLIKKDDFGSLRIDRVKMSDAKQWMINLQSGGRGYSSLHALHSIVSPAFRMAVDDDMIRKNPFGFKLSEVVANDSIVREALTAEQERRFLEFVRNDAHFCKYYDGIYILLNTGLRISELCGLTLSDIDFKNRKIIVDHQLQRRHNIGYEVTATKTFGGVREIPMMDEVYECFARVVRNRRKPEIEPVIDGRAGFLFIDQNYMPTVAMHWEKYFREIRNKYNAYNDMQMPKITPHVCRHTFCSNMAKLGMNPKTLQYIMGHSNIGVTLGTYTHVQYEDAKKEMFEAKIRRESAM